MVVRKLEIPVSSPDQKECPECMRRFAERLGSLAGVQDVQQRCADSCVVLSFDPDQLSPEALERSARAIGVDLEQRFGHRAFALDGLDCTDCARKIQAAAQRQPGVFSASVSFPASTLFLEYDPSRTDLNAIIACVRRLGYQVAEEPPPAGEPARIAPPERREDTLLRRRVWLTGASGLALALGLVAEFGLRWETGALLIYAASALLVAPFVFRGAFGALRERTLDTDFLMGFAACGAAVLGDWREAAAVLFLYTLGETLERLTVARARGALRALAESFPSETSVLRDGREERIPTATVRVGDVVLIRPGERVPVDGVVVSGESEMDEALVTGESVPRLRAAGETVFAGSINGSGALEVHCTRVTAENTVNRIIHMVEDAQSRKAPQQRLTERFGRVYTPCVVALAAAVVAVGPLVTGQTLAESFRRALVLLTVSCPCALALSAPVAVVSALAAAAKNGLLVKGGAVLEALGRVRTVFFDKTGTLTRGRLDVTDVIPLEGVGRERLLAVAASVESRSEHLLGRAIVRHAEESGISVQPSSDYQAVVGRGATAQTMGGVYSVGNAHHMHDGGLNPAELEGEALSLAAQGKTILYVANEECLLGLIALRDTVRPEAPGVFSDLRTLGVDQLVMLTGDRAESAEAVGRQVGATGWQSGLLPEQKLAVVARMSAGPGAVAMVGDGINDAPALARADVGIAIASATDASSQTADVILMSDDLSRLPFGIALGRRTAGIIQANLVFSVSVVLALVALTLLGHLNLTHGVLGHEGSSLIVAGNGLRLLGARPRTAGGSSVDGRCNAAGCRCG